ncbi:ATP-binding protein [Hoeflea sp. G2-23]|uniref:histidine kinase n=1 Tax=Hoeflea algicola TaxID=2983763 RepID=A0ABT3ZCN4_9HYPH|nr:ATP-binding protein [Hoeflea algicola]MCY0149546.1 ATP-binding protein [Hoeflea algicola]
MSTEPSRLQEALSLALNQQAETSRDTQTVSPAVRYPVSDTATVSPGVAHSTAARPLFAASAAMAAAAISVSFNAPMVLLASVAGIAVFAALPLLRRKTVGPSQRPVAATTPASASAGTAAKSEQEFDRSWELGGFSGQLTAVFDTLGDMVSACNLDGRIIYANDTFSKITGCDRPVGLTLEAAGITPGSHDDNGNRELTLGEGSEQTIWTWHEKAARDPATGQLLVHCIGRNITATRRAEVELVEAREKAEAASHAKTRFLAAVSHEIRTPLNGIMGMTHLLEQTETTPEQASYLKTARESGQALLSLIEDLLDVTSIEAGRLNLRREQGNLEELVHGVCELMASRAHEKDIEIAVHIAPDAPQRITSDIGRLRQVLFNLVGNAIKFTEAGGVLVEVALENNKLNFIVSDTGPGLKDEDKTRIFDEFERADNGPTRKHGGAGLGLSISARIVEALGGEIGVVSKADRGSAFHFTVPLQDFEATDTPVMQRGPLADRAVLVIAPRGPVSTAMLWSIRDLGGFAEAADDAETIIAALTRLNRSGAFLSDILVDRRIAEHADSLLAAAPTVLPDTVARTLVIAPEDSRDLEGHGAHGADAWLVRPVRRTSLINVLTRRDDRDDRDRLASKPRPPVLVRSSEHPTLDILLAEDDPVNALVVRTVLARQGHRVTVVDNGRKLIEKAMERPGGVAGYDLVITDLSMPEVDGRTAITRIRSEEEVNQLARLPIIVLSADGQASTRDDLLAAGADGHAEKPVDPEWLVSLASVTARKRERATG